MQLFQKNFMMEKGEKNKGVSRMPDEEQQGYTFIKLFSTIKAIITHFRPFQEHFLIVVFYEFTNDSQFFIRQNALLFYDGITISHYKKFGNFLKNAYFCTRLKILLKFSEV